MSLEIVHKGCDFLSMMEVDDGNAGIGVASGLDAHLSAQVVVRRPPDSSVTQAPERHVDRIPRWKIFGIAHLFVLLIDRFAPLHSFVNSFLNINGD